MGQSGSDRWVSADSLDTPHAGTCCHESHDSRLMSLPVTPSQSLTSCYYHPILFWVRIAWGLQDMLHLYSSKLKGDSHEHRTSEEWLILHSGLSVQTLSFPKRSLLVKDSPAIKDSLSAPNRHMLCMYVHINIHTCIEKPSFSYYILALITLH